MSGENLSVVWCATRAQAIIYTNVAQAFFPEDSIRSRRKGMQPEGTPLVFLAHFVATILSILSDSANLLAERLNKFSFFRPFIGASLSSRSDIRIIGFLNFMTRIGFLFLLKLFLVF